MSFEYSSKYKEYKKAVIGNERSNHTFTKRLNTILSLGKGLNGEIIDIGCGYGFRTIELSKAINGSVVGIDVDSTRIEEAEKFVRENGIQNCRFKVMDAESLEFGEGRFDVVVADEMIHHVRNLDKVISEMHRVLKNGGIAMISDHNKWSLASDLVRYFKFGKNKEKVFSAGEIKSCFQQAGFSDIMYKHILFTLPFYNLPKSVMRLNYFIEECIERTKVASHQCGVYVIRGIK